MSADSTTAIVLRTVDFSETSVVVTLFSRDFGKISALAKGARRLKSPFEGSLDLLGVCGVVVICKRSDTLDLLTESKLRRRFRAGERSLERLYAGYYVAEMLRLLTDEHDPHPDVYDLAIETLTGIDGDGEIASCLLRFDLQTLRMLGHAPGTESCTSCGGEVAGAARLSFSLQTGGLVCGGCRTRLRQTISVRREVVEAIRQWKSPQLPTTSRLPNGLYGELRAILNRYLQTITGCVPRMQSFLPTVTRMESTA